MAPGKASEYLWQVSSGSGRNQEPGDSTGLFRYIMHAACDVRLAAFQNHPEDVPMRGISRFLVAVGAMMIALVWSIMQEPPRVERAARPLPTVASTTGASTIQIDGVRLLR